MMAKRNRAVNVATVTQDGISARDKSALLEETFQRLEQASCRKPDIVCLPENFAGFRKDSLPTLPCPMTDRLGAWARAKNCYVISAMRVLEGNRHYNACVLIDRQGEIVGQYNKAHPGETEISPMGTHPGTLDVPVFKTDFGVIGIQICFDANWPDTWKLLKKKGAEIVFFSSAYPATMHCSAFARENEYYVVSSTYTRPSCIFDITGEIMASTGMFQQWADATLHLSKRLFEIDLHVGKMREVEKKYGERVRVRWYHDEDQFTLASLDPDLAVEDILKEFDLLPLSDYIASNTKAQNAAR